MVKTRLAHSLSPAAVTDFYRCLLDDTLALARSLRRCGGCHHVPCFGRRRTNAVGARCGERRGAERVRVLLQA